MNYVKVRPEILRWVLERSGASQELRANFPQLAQWEEGKVRPTFGQLEEFARAARAPFGYLFLSEPMEEPLPIADFRTRARRVSPDLISTLYLCEARKEWYRSFARANDFPKVRVIGSATLEDRPEEVAADICRTLEFEVDARAGHSSWEDALRFLAEQADKIGILVMTSEIADGDTERILDPEEFSGFAMANSYAPLVFINGAAAKSAQMFTLAHELAHLWLGESALSDASVAPIDKSSRREEKWCNAVAAELLVPLNELRQVCAGIAHNSLETRLQHLAGHFKVSRLVMLRRLLDAAVLDCASFDREWDRETKALRSREARKTADEDSGSTTISRVGRRFAKAVVNRTGAVDTLYEDAFYLLGIRKTKAFDQLAQTLGLTS